VVGITREEGGDVYDYFVNLSPFSISQRINGEVSAETSNTLYFENGSTDAPSGKDGTCFDALKARA